MMHTTTRSTFRVAGTALAAVLVCAGAVLPVHAGEMDDRRAEQAAPQRAEGHEAKGEERSHRPGHGRTGKTRAGKGDRGQGAARGNGHTPVTVCHSLGNGGYNLLTFDENALRAHKGHGDLYPVPEGGCPTAPAGGTTQPGSGSGEGGGEGEGGHTPVTVCHVLGHGGFIELTFDDDALDAHLDHGDQYPLPADGCPVDDGTTGDETVAGGAGDDTLEGTDGRPTTGLRDASEAQVLGVEQLAGASGGADRTDDAQVAGAATAAGANRAATGPLAGILPQTGAAPMALAGAAGLALVVIGGTVLARRRSQLG